MSDFGRRLVFDQSFDAVVGATIESLRATGFVVTAADVQHLIQQEVGRDCRRYVVLTATSVAMLARAIRFDLDAGASVPFAMAIYELADGETAVAAGEPMSELSYSVAWQREEPELAEVAAALGEQVGRALSGIAGRLPHRAAA